MKAAHVLIEGRVQGVWFRESMREQAERHRVAGWVRNLPDGRVEAHVQGEDDGVDTLLHWCHDGPERARVDRVTATPAGAAASEGFQVRH